MFDLHHGDCLEVMPTLQQGSVAMVFADLPYGCTKNAWDCRIDLAHLWPNVWAALKPRGAAVLTATQPFTTAIIASQPQHFRYDLVWHKNWPTGYWNANRQPLRAHESIVVLCKRAPQYNAVKTPGKAYFVQRKNDAKNEQNYAQDRRTPTSSSGLRYPQSVLAIPRSRKEKSSHPTQKPVALLEWLIATYTNPGQTVLDPCMGSGTTGVACANLGRRFIGIEKNATYFAAAKTRIEAAYAASAQVADAS